MVFGLEPRRREEPTTEVAQRSTLDQTLPPGTEEYLWLR